MKYWQTSVRQQLKTVFSDQTKINQERVKAINDYLKVVDFTGYQEVIDLLENTYQTWDSFSLLLIYKQLILTWYKYSQKQQCLVAANIASLLNDLQKRPVTIDECYLTSLQHHPLKVDKQQVEKQIRILVENFHDEMRCQ